jgi:hypothetical protein
MTSYGQNVRISDNPLFSDESVSDMEICSPRNQVPNIKECTRELNQDDKGHIPSSTTTASSHVVNTPDKNDVSFRRLGSFETSSLDNGSAHDRRRDSDYNTCSRVAHKEQQAKDHQH